MDGFVRLAPGFNPGGPDRFHRLPGLANAVAGHDADTRGRMMAQEIIALYTAELVTITEPALLIIINKLFRRNMTPDELYEATRGDWVLVGLSDIVGKHEMKVYAKEPAEFLKWIHTIVSNAKAFIMGTYHGLDQKHLQAYLDEFCYRFNRRTKREEIFSRLLAACVDGPPLTYAELVA